MTARRYLLEKMSRTLFKPSPLVCTAATMLFNGASQMLMGNIKILNGAVLYFKKLVALASL